MDYLKYFGLSMTLLVAIMFLGPYLGHVPFTVLALIPFLLMRRLGKPAHCIAYVLWIAAFIWWVHESRIALAQWALAHPDEYKPQHEGFLLGGISLMGALAMNPVSYGLGRLAMFAWNKWKRPRPVAGV